MLLFTSARIMNENLTIKKNTLIAYISMLLQNSLTSTFCNSEQNRLCNPPHFQLLLVGVPLLLLSSPEIVYDIKWPWMFICQDGQAS